MILEPAIYNIRELVHTYGGHPVLAVDAFSIQPAAIVGLIGPNGSGKSTLLKLLGFIEKPAMGEIRFKGRPAEPFSAATRFRVTLLTQEPYLMKRTVYGNMAYGLKVRGIAGDFKKRIYRALRWVGLDGDQFANRRWYELSGGEAQRVALAARLVLEPEVLLMDEPTASVDAASVQRIKDAALRARQEWGTTLVIASHDWPWLYEICDEIRHLFRGRFSDTAEENIVFGPWDQRGDGLWQKNLPNGQHFVVSAPPGPKAVAVIPSHTMIVCGEKPETTGSCSQLAGIVSRLIHERHTGDIVVTILVGNVPFTVKLSRAEFRRSDLFPGREVVILYHPDQVKWSP